MSDRACLGVRSCAAVASVLRTIGSTTLGAGVALSRTFVDVFARLLNLAGSDVQTPRHHGGRVREQAKAAARAARAAGVFRHGKTRR